MSAEAAETPRLPPLPQRATDIARAVATEGGRALVVGGWVRDGWLGLASKDVDLEVYGLDAAALAGTLARFGSVNTVGESFTVYKVGDIDVALPRRESKIGRGHRGFVVTGDPYLSPEDAARRRDFTVNAIAWDPLTGEWIDPFHGREALDARRLEAVDPATFGDDSLRVLRALQFTARFAFSLEPRTAALCRSIPLDDLPSERIWGEVEKLLLKAARPSWGLALGLDLGVVARLWPEMQALAGCPQDPEWHPEGDVWVHTLMVIDEMRARLDGWAYPAQVALMLGAVAHDFGKPATTAVIDGRWRSPGHEELGGPPATRWLDALNIHSLRGFDVRRAVLGLVAHHLKPGMWHKAEKVGAGAFRRLAQKIDLELLAAFAEADCVGRAGTFDCSAMSWFRERARAIGVQHAPPAPLLLGRDVLALGIAPGPEVGRILRAVYERQLDGVIQTTGDAIAEAMAVIARRGGA